MNFVLDPPPVHLRIALGAVLILAFVPPIGAFDGVSTTLTGEALDWPLVTVLIGIGLGVVSLGIDGRTRTLAGVFSIGAGVLIGIALMLQVWRGLNFSGFQPTLWALLAGIGWLLWRGLSRLATVERAEVAVAVPLLFGAMLVYLWEVLVVGYGVPRILLPAPTAIAEVLTRNADVLWVDFFQTYVRSAVPGFVIGCGTGFFTAVAIDRSPFLQRGLLPLGSMISAMPIVGIAPIMIMWFGFDWHSKAAVVVIMTFFPMLVNTLAGLQSAGAMECDLMRSYAATYAQTLTKLRLPGAMPFVFNALKLNSTLALIGAIVSEFFGTPIYGMGFRISTEVARLNVDMVWATIVVAAVAGSASYGALAVVERAVTFWHPSFRK